MITFTFISIYVMEVMSTKSFKSALLFCLADYTQYYRKKMSGCESQILAINIIYSRNTFI